MKPIVAAGCITLILLPRSELRAGPRCEPSENPVDFGKVSQFEEKKRTVKVSNGGDDALRIDRVRTCCGFAAQVLSDRIVSPGRYAEILVTCRPLLKTGSVEDRLLIFTNDREHPESSVSLKAKVIRRFALTPRALNFGTLDYGQTKTLSLRLQPASDTGIRNVRLRCPKEKFDTKCVVAPDGSSTRIEMTVRPGAPVGSLSSLIEGTCVTDRERPFAFYVHGSIVGKILVMPPKMIFARVEQNRSYEKIVRLIGRRGRKFRVLNAKCDGKPIDVRTMTVSESEHLVIVGFTPEKDGTNFKALITVATDDELHKKIEIPVLVLYER